LSWSATSRSPKAPYAPERLDLIAPRADHGAMFREHRDPGQFAQHRAVWRRAAVLVGLCVGLAVFESAENLHEALLEVLAVAQTVVDRHPIAGTLLFVAFAAVSAMFTFVSIAVLVPAAVYVWGEPGSMALLWLGWILGGAATYGIGTWFGRPVVRWVTSNPALLRFEHRVQQNAPFWLILLLQLALPSEVPGYVLGLARYPFLRYLLALAIAELPYTVATVYLGTSFLERRRGVILGAGLAIALLSVVAFYLLRRVLKSAGENAGNPSV